MEVEIFWLMSHLFSNYPGLRGSDGYFDEEIAKLGVCRARLKVLQNMKIDIAQQDDISEVLAIMATISHINRSMQMKQAHLERSHLTYLRFSRTIQIQALQRLSLRWFKRSINKATLKNEKHKKGKQNVGQIGGLLSLLKNKNVKPKGLSCNQALSLFYEIIESKVNPFG